MAEQPLKLRREGGREGEHPDRGPCSTAHTWGRPGVEVPGTHRLIVNMEVWEPFCSSRWNARISRCCVGFSLQSLTPGGLNRFLQKQQLLRSYCELFFFFFFLNSFFFSFFFSFFLAEQIFPGKQFVCVTLPCSVFVCFVFLKIVLISAVIN